MKNKGTLETELKRIDGRPYPAYKDLLGCYDFDFYELSIDRVQGDPFASPSRVSIKISHEDSGLPLDLHSNESRRTGSENFLALSFSEQCGRYSSRNGSGKSGLIAIDTPGQEMLQRSCVEIGDTETIVRFSIGLPANGRRIRGSAASELLVHKLPLMVESALCYGNIDSQQIEKFANTAEDADSLRATLEPRKLVAFIADGATLPRSSGVDQRPLSNAIPFQSTDSLRLNIELPHAGKITGMGIPEGVTLIVGGGYHGKSTLLSALERGVYNHRPGDGRELVVSKLDCTKVRAEDGRSVQGVDLTPFIGELPGRKDSSQFSTENASGSSSQAAAIIETIETGSKTLLIDEDISATNLLIRDARMQKLIAKDKEPITPFVQRVKPLYEKFNVSTILVLGGSGDYFEPADLVIAMDNYLPADLTVEAKRLCQPDPKQEKLSLMSLATNPEQSRRWVEKNSITPIDTNQKRGRTRTRGTRSLDLGNEEIDISLVSQIVDPSQLRLIGEILQSKATEELLAEYPLPEALRRTLQSLSAKRISGFGKGDLAEVRLQELTATLNRLRTLRVK